MSAPGSGGDGRECAGCGAVLAPGAVFCRSCGAKYEVPAPEATSRRDAPAPHGARRNRTALWVGAAIVLAAAGAALAILVASGGGSSSTTVVVDGETTTTVREEETESGEGEPEGDPISGAVEAARYVQAGSFKTVANAEVERERLAAAGIDVAVVPSDDAEELYPGFQVLLGGPFSTGSAEAATVKALEKNGVPSAFGRPLSPALEVGDPAGIAGSWSGALDRSSGDFPKLNGSLPVSLELDSDGRTGTLEFESENCRDELTLRETTAATLSYARSEECAASGNLLVRPAAGELMLSVLPLDTDALVLGSLSPG